MLEIEDEEPEKWEHPKNKWMHFDLNNVDQDLKDWLTIYDPSLNECINSKISSFMFSHLTK